MTTTPVTAATAPAPARAWVRAASGLIREHAPLLAVAAAVIAGSGLLAAALGVPRLMRNLGYPPSYQYFVRILLLPLPFAFLWLRLRARDADGRWLEGRPGWSAAWGRYRRDYLNAERVAGALLAGVIIAACINQFGAWKLSIPRLHPFSWDVALSRLDRAMHFGRHPWEWLQPWVGHPAVTNVLDFTYYTWLPLVAIVCAWQAWSPRRGLRMRFLVTFVLIWILLGALAATLLSSAGPVYYGRVVGGPDPYAPLFAYLESVARVQPLGTPIVQEGLWQRYIGATASPYTGISAMPSIHVAMPVLYAIVGWRTHRLLGAAFAGYAGLILLGSVHLGWHYAVDGYASVLGVLALWAAVDRAVGWWERRGLTAGHRRP